MADLPTQGEDAFLAERLHKGDPTALGELFSCHRDRLSRIVQFRMDRRLTTRIDVEDVLQDAYLAAQARVQHFISKPDASAFVWLRLIVQQSLVDLHRRHIGAERRAADRDVRLEANGAGAGTSACLAAELAGSITSPSQAAVRVERASQLEAALKSMTDGDQEIIALRHFEELTNAEAAEVLGLSPTAASNRYVRALSRLRDVLAEFPDFATW